MIDWNKQPFGIESDRSISKRLGVCRKKVAKERRNRDICSLKDQHVVVDWDVVPLGKKTDEQLAIELGVSKSTVFVERRKRNISSYKLSMVDWDLQPLGEMSDTKLAKIIGTSQATVSSNRRKRGIAIYIEPQVTEGRAVNWDEISFGDKTDDEIAKDLGVHKWRVFDERIKREVSSWREQKQKSINWDEQSLGKKSDYELAKELGVTHETVRIIRIKKGIRSWQSSIIPEGINYDKDQWCGKCHEIKEKECFIPSSWGSLHGSTCHQCRSDENRRRRREEVDFRIKGRLRQRLRHEFAKQGLKKEKKADEYGINYLVICKHLGEQRSKSHVIDHIVPLAFFDFNDEEQIRLAFVPENHRWLDKKENGSKLDWLPIEETGRRYRLVPLEDKIHIYNEILENFYSKP